MDSTRIRPFAQLIATAGIFVTLLVMGMQFTVHHFMSKQSLIFPTIILSIVLIYHLLLDRKLITNKNNLLVFGSLLLFAVYYVLNINGNVPLKLEYISYFLIIVLLFTAIVFFKNRIVDKRMWIVFVFLYANVFFLPILLSINNLIAANSNGIIAFLLLFFCLINLNEKNIFLKSLNIYTTILLVITLFTATSRAAMMAFLIVVFVFFTIKYVHKFTFYIVACLILLSPAVTGIYIYLKHTTVGQSLNDLSLQVTSKNFFSGRDTIWSDAVNKVFENGAFWTGLGINMEFQQYGGYLHNLYVQVFYQSGFIGLILVGLLLLSIAIAVGKAKVVDTDFRILSGYLTAILFLQVFEGHLIYRFEIISVLMWIIIAFLIRKSSHKPSVSLPIKAR
ncbi:O-antigen ligase family protein [Planomicrobium okeanokoites]|uniref:O-antigen ligase family protein n=1 Tax=Planomicrobium okeanokoites TaxID=244 RepID=UPI000A006E03|nr:O-antigen ligase family protein [Planomicrobium okeanokoites]